MKADSPVPIPSQRQIHLRNNALQTNGDLNSSIVLALLDIAAVNNDGTPETGLSFHAKPVWKGAYVAWHQAMGR